MNQLEHIIKQHISLGRPNSKGWYPILCKLCNDHGKKGMRAAFMFTQSGLVYNCFNCGGTASYEPNQDRNPSDEMITVFDSFGIPAEEWKKVILDALTNPQQIKKQEELLTLEPTATQLLPFFYPLTDNPDDDWCQYSIQYLTERGIDWTSYPFFCVKKADHPDNKRWYGRLIIPIYKDDKLVFYQGRDLTDMHIKKYLSANTPRDTILYGYDHILANTTDPLYVVEGWFDAYALKGVAVFSNKLTKQQIQWLNRSRRPKVIIPDRYGDGHRLANQAISLGWNISTLDMNDSCKDVSDSIQKHGLLYTMKTISSNIVSGEIAKTIVNIYCRKNV